MFLYLIIGFFIGMLFTNILDFVYDKLYFKKLEKDFENLDSIKEVK